MKTLTSLCSFALWILTLSDVLELKRVEGFLIWKNYERENPVPSRKSAELEDVGEPLLLTPYIKQNKLKEAKEAARVDLGLNGLGLESYAGYLTVNEEHNSNTWFWYFPVSGKPVEETPWLIWLQGGPGSSSLYGLFNEIGPYKVVNYTLQEMEYSWGQNHSLLFIDNPVGTGFSFTDENGYATNQTEIGENLYDALQQFLTIFPELRKAPLTIAGESYAGKHVPSIGIQILRKKDESQPINVHGLAIGNGFIDPITLMHQSYFLKAVGLIDDKSAGELETVENEVVKLIKEGNLVEAFQLFLEMNPQTLTSVENVYNYLRDDDPMQKQPYEDLVVRSDIRRALHVGNTSFSSLSLAVYESLENDFMNSAKPWLEELLNNYKVMVYSGHLDTMVPYPASTTTYASLNFNGVDEYINSDQSNWYYDGILAGKYKKGGNLLEVMVRGAGHMVPEDRPAAALAIISAFVRDVDPANI